ncbi:glutathione S-transferase family protein [Paracoccus sp. 1_MG-2023]|uniref:glutathione S-transferase family protein n=1 Tax=unclassified Paracoccus (in: a-proteobacteria) TaxID=2688777 RepID=UPI001C0A5E5B|nr:MULTISPECIES: glutathione S-transferase family protein [unclassified Paracoccus (in: a-proteobacteria)]MBU2957130.1 glutathione S-transferase family protein [Paracoccus sp. C2R09]MDO6669536.1 glutathione S-transferase family protein [Paracoccus sp. 1_MG-2023]
MRLYSMPSSGNSYKVRLLLALTGRACEIVDVEDGSEALIEAKTAGALPFGKAPVLHLEDGRTLPESNAILCWLGEGTRFWPGDAFDRATMMSWMFWEQNQHEGVIAVRAALRCYPSRASLATPDRMEDLLIRGHALLSVMERRLEVADWLAGEAATLADVALYAYTHTAGSRGGFEMDRFPAVNAWLARVAGLPNHVGLDD